MDLDRRSDNRMEWLLALGFALFAVLCRVAPYLVPGGWLWHLMPIGALALFAGSRLRQPLGLLVPLGAMLVSDLLLIAPLASMGYSAFGWSRPIVYASFAAMFGLGLLVRSTSFNPLSILLAALAGSLQFFLITNFAAWLANIGTLYTADLAGLLACYEAAIPFYRGTLVGDLVFTGVLFGLHAAALHRMREPVPIPQESEDVAA